MHKIISTLLLSLLLTACSSSPPPRPEPTGTFTAVNPAQVNIHALMQ
ncbi:hypothetical protein [Photobacterium indicum]